MRCKRCGHVENQHDWDYGCDAAVMIEGKIDECACEAFVWS